jgi:hypothetical protein
MRDEGVNDDVDNNDDTSRTTLTYRKLKLKSVGVAQFIPMSLVNAKNMNEGRDDDIIITK